MLPTPAEPCWAGGQNKQQTLQFPKEPSPSKLPGRRRTTCHPEPCGRHSLTLLPKQADRLEQELYTLLVLASHGWDLLQPCLDRQD